MNNPCHFIIIMLRGSFFHNKFSPTLPGLREINPTYVPHTFWHIETIQIIISISTGGDIGSEVRYTANGEHSGMYICLDPIQGGSFAGGLTAKVGSAAEASLTGQGMHMYMKGM